MVRQHDALGNFLERREQVVVIARRDERIDVRVEPFRRVRVARAHMDGVLRRRERGIRRAVEIEIDNGLAFIALLVGVDGRLGRAELRPVAHALADLAFRRG